MRRLGFHEKILLEEMRKSSDTWGLLGFLKRQTWGAGGRIDAYKIIHRAETVGREKFNRGSFWKHIVFDLSVVTSLFAKDDPVYF